MTLIVTMAWVCRIFAQGASTPRSYDTEDHLPLRIPVTGTGYRPPGELPAFQYYSLVSLHFTDATHLLFTFNITGLIQRDDQCAGDDDERMVRAVVLELPSGHVTNQKEWKLYDFSDFLWPLGGGQFLLRRCSQLNRVGATLIPTPWISLGGALEYLGLSPDHSVLLIEEKPLQKSTDKAGNTAASNPLLSQQANSILGSHPEPELNVEFIRVHPLAVIARSHIPRAADIPIVSQGFLEMLPALHDHWAVTLQTFQGPKRDLVAIHSLCTPSLTPVSNEIFIAGVCPKSDQRAFQAYDFQGSMLWQMPSSPDRILPRFIRTRDGAHFALETLHASHPRAPLDPLSSQDVDAEIVDVFDTRTGRSIASFRVAPIYTGGRNVAFSPDDSKLAVLNGGAIEVYKLDALANDQQVFPK